MTSSVYRSASPQKDRPLKPVVFSIGGVKAWRRSEVVLVGGNRLARGYTIQHILCAMPDSRVADLDPDRVRRLDDIVRFCQRKSVTVNELPVGSSGQDATGNPGPPKSPTGDRDRAPEPKGAPPEFEYRSDTDPQFEGELEARRYPCFDQCASPRRGLKAVSQLLWSDKGREEWFPWEKTTKSSLAPPDFLERSTGQEQ